MLLEPERFGQNNSGAFGRKGVGISIPVWPQFFLRIQAVDPQVEASDLNQATQHF